VLGWDVDKGSLNSTRTEPGIQANGVQVERRETRKVVHVVGSLSSRGKGEREKERKREREKERKREREIVSEYWRARREGNGRGGVVVRVCIGLNS
jgi:hypothetical protein